jgi:hypothetical protein
VDSVRGLLPALVLLLLLVPQPSLAAAGEPHGVRVLEDPQGDVALANPSGTPVPVSAEQFSSIDILAADVLETEDGFFFTLWVAAFPPASPVPFTGGQVALLFRHADVGYGVEYNMFSTFRSAALLVDPSLSGQYDYQTELDLTVDEAAARMTAFVPRQLLGDRDGAPPFPGRSFEGFQALSQGAGFGGNIQVMDVSVESIHASDEAGSTSVLPILLGVRQDGAARLAASRPFRASNGEAATFIFEVEATNAGEAEAFYRLEAVRTPANWQVTFPQAQLRLDAGESILVPVLATVPFAHQHGRLASFLVEMKDLADPASVGRVELGLHYTEPAQPAGHHSQLFLHSRAPDQFISALGTAFNVFGHDISMNTLEQDPLDQAAAIPGQFGGLQGGTPPRVTFSWFIPLSPALQMGIDVDLARTGTLHIPVSTTLPMPAAVLDGYLYVYSFTPSDDEDDFFGTFEETPIAQLVPTAPVEVGAASSAAFDTAIVPLRSGDYLAYDPEANLVLQLNLSFERPALFTTPEAPVIQPGGHLQLPLLEYADPVDDLFTGDLGLALEPMGGAERRAPPGGATLFTVNATGPAGHYALLAHGPESAWVEFPAGDLHVEDDGAGRTQVLVRVPADAADGSVVDLVVEAAGGPADAVRSLTRLRVTVDATAPDETALAAQPGAKDTPGPAPALALLALAALALARRGRHA